MSNSMYCLICDTSFECEKCPNPQHVTKVFRVCCRLLKIDVVVEKQWNFHSQTIPFCAFCFSTVENLWELDENLQAIKHSIDTILQTIKLKIHKSARSSQNKIKNSYSKERQNFRNQILKEFEPNVLISKGSIYLDEETIAKTIVPPSCRTFNTKKLSNLSQTYRVRKQSVNYGDGDSASRQNLGEYMVFDNFIQNVDSTAMAVAEDVRDPLFEWGDENTDTKPPVIPLVIDEPAEIECDETWSPRSAEENPDEDPDFSQSESDKSNQSPQDSDTEYKPYTKRRKLRVEKTARKFPKSTTTSTNLANKEKTLAVAPCEDFAEGETSIYHQVKIKFENGVYKCGECEFTSASLAGVRVHITYVHPDTITIPHTCEFCGKIFENKESLTSHKISHRSTAKVENWNCDICGKIYKLLKPFSRHRKNHHGLNEVKLKHHPFKCQQCKKSFVKSISLIEHVRIHTGEKPYICPLEGCCGRRFDTFYNLTRHKRLHQSGFKCNFEGCNRMFPRNEMLRRHKQNCHSTDKSVKYDCSHCDKCFTYKWQLRSHLRILQIENKTRFFCEKCGVDVCSMAGLRRHRNDMTTRCNTSDFRKRFPCETCGIRFYTTKSLLRHISEIHDDTNCNNKEFKCTVTNGCNRSYTSVELLNRHLQYHLEKNKCPHCDKRFTLYYYLRKHIKKYHLEIQSQPELHQLDEQQLKSSEIVGSFAYSIENQLLEDKEDVRFKCNYCDQSFSTQIRLDYHAVKHFNAKNFQCGICGVRMKSRTSVNHHFSVFHKGIKIVFTRIRHETPPPLVNKNGVFHGVEIKVVEKEETTTFACGACEYFSTNKGIVQAHIRTKHLDLDTEPLLKCKYCEKSFGYLYALKTHEQTHPEGGEKNYECPQCESKFRTSAQLRFHRHAVHDKVEYYQCSLCPKRYILKRHWLKHTKANHKEAGSAEEIQPIVLKPDEAIASIPPENYHGIEIKCLEEKNLYECSVCGYSRPMFRNVKTHVRMNHASATTEYKCDLCDKSYRRRGTLRKHVMKQHENIPVKKNIICDQCGLSFRDNHGLRGHKNRVHFADQNQ